MVRATPTKMEGGATQMIIKQQIESETLQNKIFELLDESVHLIPKDNNNIGYITLLHKGWTSWENNKYAYLLPVIEQELPGVETDDILSFGFLYSNPGCITQRWHIDYSGRSEIFFIPTVDVDETNGTEYLEFADAHKGMQFKQNFVDITNDFIDNDDLRDYLKNSLGLADSEYCFKIANAPKMSLIKISHYLLHRGRTNTSGAPRIVFFVCTSKDRDFLSTLPTEIVVPDAELDEPDQESKVLRSREKVSTI
jgi:hypothetical protein